MTAMNYITSLEIYLYMTYKLSIGFASMHILRNNYNIPLELYIIKNHHPIFVLDNREFIFTYFYNLFLDILDG